MANYKVVTDRVAGKAAGDTVTDDELSGINVAALIEAGHIVGETQPKTQKADKE
jgi:hypothetical protein